MALRSRAGTSGMRTRTKVWLELDGEYVFGLGISNILKAVAETGSIKEAAGLLGKSYRHVWARIKEVERNLGMTLVRTRVGGGDTHRSELTAAARLLVDEFDSLRTEIFELVEKRFPARLKALRDAAER